MLGLLNSLLAAWYFRLGSTNAAVSHYQISDLPCPVFRETATKDETAAGAAVAKQLKAGRPDAAFVELSSLLATAPFSPAVRDAVAATVDVIVGIEANRGEMTRADRSALSVSAQPYQDFLHRLFFGLAGFTDAEVAALRVRYEQMKKVKYPAS